MRRLMLIPLLLLVLGSARVLHAQAPTLPQEGDPPVAALISVSVPDEEGVVTITGGQGTVFATAQVAIRNLFTGETVYANAGFNGTFSAQIYGPGKTPFMISPARSIPEALRDQPGSLPGGPATIVYGANPEPRSNEAITALIVDGQLNDWDAYPDAALADGVHALLNQDSLYLGLEQDIPAQAALVVVLNVNGATTYELTINPDLPGAALLRMVEPVEREPVAVSVAAARGESGTPLELRVDMTGLTFEIMTLEQVFVRVGDDARDVNTITRGIPIVAERDGIVYPNGRMEGDFSRFYIAGALANGASYWWAVGRVDTLIPQPGDTIDLEIDVTLVVPELPTAQTGLSLIAEIGLQPVTIGENGEQNISALHTNNGWGSLLTPSGLAIDNLRGDVSLGMVQIPSQQVIRRGDELLAGFRFELQIPANLPLGLYVPTFKGAVQIADGDVVAWSDTSLFGVGDMPSRLSIDRLPVVLNVGAIDEARLSWTLFYDTPSDGSRGLLSEEDSTRIALSNRVRFNAPSYILAPGTYAVEPYMLNQMPNAYDVSLSPLLPFLFPGGRISGSITKSDGDQDELPEVPFIQSRLSTAAVDERDAFGPQPPLDSYRLMTGNTFYHSFPFDQYGEYTITLDGSLEDISGNRYSGGGTYQVVVAERLDFTPGVLSGTPFAVGDVPFLGGYVVPGVPAEATVTLKVYPLSGEVTEETFTFQADQFGTFAPDVDFEAPRFDQAGEYVLDYELRYTNAAGVLYAASYRSAGIIASTETTLTAHGQRGINGHVDGYRPAWFDTAQYPPLEALSTAQPRPNFPYFSGDVAFIPDTTESGLHAVLYVQDRVGSYQRWLGGTIPGYVSAFGLSLQESIAADELPAQPVLGGALNDEFGAALLPGYIANQAYSYISAVRPDVTVRQFVLGQADDGLPFYWDNDDPLNRQIGAGVDGNRAGDFIFLFGGVIIKNAEANVREALPYAALAIVTNEEATAQVVPPLNGNEAINIPPLRTIDGVDYDAFFHPTAIRPGQIVSEGQAIHVAGQAAPTLPTRVSVKITAPSGRVTEFSGMSNDIGYYFDPAQGISADQVGVWHVQILTTPSAETSVGIVDSVPTGRVLGVVDTFDFYVVPSEPSVLAWSRGGDVNEDYAPGTPLNLSISVPGGWTDTRAFVSVVTPSYLMDSASLQIFGTSASYQYNPTVYARDFPLETTNGAAGMRGGDVVTVNFVVFGRDEAGEPAAAIRRMVVLHDRLLSIDEQVLNEHDS